ncbi:DNA-directed RNA polymerase subunit alpha [Patescibacteria group bacterium]|nr:DNA-directed RNA polymerase subunit alpha [Patescibacteria group bacterium]
MEAILIPNTIKLEKEEGNEGIFIVEPCYPGYGHTLGNALRRVLLSSLPGAAVSGVKIKGASHEFDTLDNIKEDVIEIILNLKMLRLKVHSDEPVTLKLDVKGKKDILAKDIETPSDVEIVTPDLLIATATNKDAHFEAELMVEKGRGYVPVEKKNGEDLDIGMILIDSSYCPIEKVSYDIQNIRVGQRTDYDQLRISIVTDGTISPREALTKSSELLVDHFAFITGAKSAKKEEEMKEEEKKEDVEEPDTVLDTIVQKLNLSTRTSNALDRAKIRTVGDLASRSEGDLLSLEGFGETALKEIKSSLKKLDLTLHEEEK